MRALTLIIVFLVSSCYSGFWRNIPISGPDGIEGNIYMTWKSPNQPAKVSVSVDDIRFPINPLKFEGFVDSQVIGGKVIVFSRNSLIIEFANSGKQAVERWHFKTTKTGWEVSRVETLQ
jgi:hypothetical protein